MGDHWLIGKCGYFDGSYHIPLIVRDPRPQADSERGAVVSSFTENVDIMPTMLEAIGAEIPVQCDGASLAPFLEGRAVPRNGAPKRTGSSTSAIPPTTRRSARWDSRCINAR